MFEYSKTLPENRVGVRNPGSMVRHPHATARRRMIEIALCLVVALYSAKAFAQDCRDLMLSSPDPIVGESFGKAMAIDGRTLVIGAPGTVDARSKNPGRAFVFKYDDDHWQLVAELSYSGSDNGDQFGTSVAIDENVIAIGAVLARGKENARTGAVYVFHRPRQGWRSTDDPNDVLTPSAGGELERFGTAIDISEDWLLVGMPLFGDEPRDHGAVFAFEYDDEEWEEREILTRPQPVRNEHFGLRIEMEGDMAVIGAPNLYWHALPGTAHVFLLGESDDDWNHMQTLSAGDDRFAGDHFGRSIALQRGTRPDDHWLVIGATGDDDHGEHSGSAHIFHVEESRNGYAWNRVSKLVADNSTKGDHLGFSCDIEGQLVILGAHSTNIGDEKNVGAMYLFAYNRKAARWDEIVSVFPDCRSDEDQFGMTSLFFVDPDSGGLQALVGVPGDDPDDVTDAGAVHVINR